MRWEKVRANPTVAEIPSQGPGKRWGHTCEAIQGGRFLYLFGGYGRDNCHTNQVHVFDTVKQTWSQPEIKGIPPIPRDSHTCTAVGDKLFVFGGTDGKNQLNDLQILDTSSHTWISPAISEEGPKAREGHSSACVGSMLYIFGGSGKFAENKKDVYYNDLYILDTETLVWKCAATSGTPPCPRDGHSCNIWENKLIVIAGEDQYGFSLSDVHMFDTDTCHWRRLKPSGLLSPRCAHVTVAFDKNFFVFGGFTDTQYLYNDLYMLEVDNGNGRWTKVITTGQGPCARFSFGGDCLDPFKDGVLVFFGGCNKNLEALDDMYYLYPGLDGGSDSSEQTPKKISFKKQPKLERQEQNLNSLQNQALVRHGASTDISLPGRLNTPTPLPSGRMFEAKITESTLIGFVIETVLDGKPLQGFLFSDKPRSLPPASHTSSSKRTSKVLKKDRMEDKREDDVHRDGTEVVAAPISGNPTTSGASEAQKVSSNPEAEAFSLNRDDDKMNDTLNSLGEHSRNGKANTVPSSNPEATTNDQTSDAPHGEIADCTTPGTEEHDEPAKSI